MTQRSYTKNYTIDTPHLKSSENKRPKYNPRLGDFTYQYSRRALEVFGFHAVSFCFFILWNKNKTDGDFNRTIWIKREITIHDNGVVNLADPFFDGTFFANENEEQLYRDLDFSEVITCSAVIWWSRICRRIFGCPGRHKSL